MALLAPSKKLFLFSIIIKINRESRKAAHLLIHFLLNFFVLSFLKARTVLLRPYYSGHTLNVRTYDRLSVCVCVFVCKRVYGCVCIVFVFSRFVSYSVCCHKKLQQKFGIQMIKNKSAIQPKKTIL